MPQNKLSKIIIDNIDDTDDFSALINTNDDTGDANADEFIRACSVAAALAYCNSKVTPEDRGKYNPEEFVSQMGRIRDMVEEYFEGPAIELVNTGIDMYISAITANLIIALSDQTKVPVFSKIKEDLSLLFLVMDGENEDQDSGGVP